MSPQSLRRYQQILLRVVLFRTRAAALGSRKQARAVLGVQFTRHPWIPLELLIGTLHQGECIIEELRRLDDALSGHNADAVADVARPSFDEHHKLKGRKKRPQIY